MEPASGIFKTKKIYFSQVSNKALRDNNLSLKAKGLYSLIQSYITIEGFVLYKTTLEKNCKDKDKSFQTAWDELKNNGYLIQKRTRKGGKFVYEYELLDECTVPPFSTHGKTTHGKRGVYIDTDLNNTDLNNTKTKDLKHIDIFFKNVSMNENIKGKFYADEDEMKSDFNKYINDFNLTAAGKDFMFELVEEFYRQLLYIKNIKHGLITEEVARKCIWIIIDNYAEYDLLDNYILYVREYFKSNRKYYSFQDFCNANTLRILSERCVKSGK